MRLLVAPVMTNKAKQNDYCCTTAGEIVFLWDCPCSEQNCPRFTFTGTESKKSSMFAEVTERPDIDEAALLEIFIADLDQRGWIGDTPMKEVEDWAHEEMALLKGLCFFEVGAIVSRTPTGVFVPKEFRNDATIHQFRPRSAA